jgi:hypothetical protein
MPKPKPSPDAAELRAQFHELYGTEHDFEGLTLAEILIRLGDLTRDITGPEPADGAFANLTRALGYTVQADEDWPEVLRDDSWSDSYCWPMGARLHDLNAFAYWGIALNDGQDAAEREALLRQEINVVSAFMDNIPFDAWGIAPSDAGRTLRRAQGRFALDTGQPIEPGMLAFLGDVSERRIRNMMAGKERTFTVDGQGRIPAEEALSWLNGRPDVFAPSVWREQNSFDDLTPNLAEVEDAVFVPVAGDNSVFHPGLAREGRYAVGRGRWEARHDNFEEALAALQRMPEPAWQRPTPRGSWTTVSAARWARHSRVDLDRIAETARSTEAQGA